MNRRPIIAGNWKMNKTHTDGLSLVRTLSYELREKDFERCEVVVCPPFTALRTVQLVLEDEHIPIALGAQNLHWEAPGAFTGEISAEFLKALHVEFVIVGHSERRAMFGETDEIVNRKAKAALAGGLVPIVCVGETADERDSGRTEEVLSGQLTASLEGINAKDIATLVVAYEPVWAIGSGRTPSPEEANTTIAGIRSVLARIANAEAADAVRIQYGGSVSAGNIAAFMSQSDIDGALVGGAALDPKSFAMIVRF